MLRDIVFCMESKEGILRAARVSFKIYNVKSEIQVASLEGWGI